VRRVLLSPRWLLGHLLALAAVAACLRLGWWQWQRAHVTGSLQNLGYAVQWPAFACFVLVFWLRVVRDQLRPPPARPQRRPATHPPADPRTSDPPAGQQSADPPAPNHPPVPHDPEDAELIAYNRYLAWLHEQDQRQPR
jgi:DNA-binding transcriptional regulator of glucitol operon